MQNDDFFLLKAAANEEGQGGIIIGFSKKQPYGLVSTAQSTRRTPAFFHDDHFKIIAFDPRFLIVRIATPYLRCVVVAAHAPHSGQDLLLLGQWWRRLHEMIPETFQQWPIILLCDANAVVGAQTSKHIGDHHAGKEDAKAEPFTAYVAQNDLWLPATFEACQVGQGATWTHTSGSTRRIDYVGLPLHWDADRCTAWVSTIIDSTILRADHAAVCVELIFDQVKPTSGFTGDKARGHHLRLDPATIDWHGIAPCTSHDLNVHSHYQALQEALVAHLQPQQQRQQKKPHKATMSPTTWDLVCEKRRWRNSLAEHANVQKRTLMEACFGAWRYQRGELVETFNDLLCLQDKLIANALANFRRLGRAVTQAMRSDDRAFFANLLADGAEFLEPHNVKKLWAVVRRSLPKFRTRKVGYSPYKLAHLEGQSAQHFEELEMGIPALAKGLVRKCVRDQAQAARRDLPEHVHLSSLPTLPELEDALRATAADRATGFDVLPSGVYHQHAAFLGKYFYQVVLKIFLWGTEPVQAKGGFLKMIPKRPGATEAKHFRGILLLPTLAKRVHAMMRTRLMQQVSRQRDPAQLGGYAGQQVSFGAQTLRALTNVFSAHGLSSAVLYVDLSTAFHHLVRQLVTGIGSQADWDVVLARLTSATTPAEAKIEGHKIVGLMDKLQVDPMLARLLRDVHESTWYSLTGQELVHTFRGTRPGSPLADMVFHLLMTDVAEALRQWLRRHPTISTVFQQMGLDPVFVIWSDNFAIPIASFESERLVEMVIELTQQVHSLFAARGFTVNFEAGKTSAVLTFLGHHAPEMRREHLLCERPGVEVELINGQKAWLHFTMKYKHLGSFFSSSHSFEPELRQRIGAAKAAYQAVFRAVLGNKHFPLQLRTRFFQSLICSRLFFGLGAWATPTLQQMSRLRRAYQMMLRKMCRRSVDEFVSNAQILHQTQSLDVRVRLAIDRLLYAQKMFQVGPDYLQQLVHLERQYCRADSWLTGVQADLRWLKQILPHALPDGDLSDLTAVIELWQSMPASKWKSILKSAVKKHKLQEEIMLDAQSFHKLILQSLREAGAVFTPDPHQQCAAERRELHPCECGRAFHSEQGLALHRWKRHGHHAPEHAFVTGATCPACMKYFWTSNRLAMHLAYIPRTGGVNQCFETLSKSGFVGKFQAQTLPSDLASAVRLDSIQAEGPLPCFADDRVRQMECVAAEIEALEYDMNHFDHPDDHATQGLRLGDALTLFTQKWAEGFARGHQADMPDLPDGWIRILDVFGRDFDEWAAFVFQQWGEHVLPDIVAELLDGEIEYILDDQFAETADLFPRTERSRRLTHLHAKLRTLQEEVHQPAIPHRPMRSGGANSAERADVRHQVPSAYHEQVQWQDTFRAVQWDEMPSCSTIPTTPNPDEGDSRPCLLVVHLFSGRRREGDLHWQLQRLAPGLRVRFVILSMDTAVSTWYGDLWHTSPAWQALRKCYALGLVAITMVGSPCETYSEARFTPPPPDEATRWPRPLRSSDWFFGLPDLTNKELRQVHAGTNFFLQGLQALGAHIVHGGLFLSEHPGMPQDPQRPTTWRAPLTQLLRQHTDVHLSHIGQWQWGAEAVKPTGLLAHRMPRLLASLYACSLPDVRRPDVAAIGKAENGEFRTSKLKEYPPALSKAFATAFGDQIRADMRAGHLTAAQPWQSFSEGPALWRWIWEAAQCSEHIRHDAPVLPDYQPR